MEGTRDSVGRRLLADWKRLAADERRALMDRAPRVYYALAREARAAEIDLERSHARRVRCTKDAKGVTLE